MDKAGLDLWFTISLFGFVPLGAIFLAWWIRRTFRPVLQAAKTLARRDPQSVHWLIMSHLWPGLLVFALCCLPLIYFNHQRSIWNYCARLARENPNLGRNDPALVLPCSCFDIDELIQRGRKKDE